MLNLVTQDNVVDKHGQIERYCKTIIGLSCSNKKNRL